MASPMQILPYSPDLLDSVLADIEGQAVKSAVRKIMESFHANSFPVKIQLIAPDKERAYYRILCYIKKGKETVSINSNKNHGRDGVDMKIRIENHNTFDKLDEFSDNIRNQIVHGYDCHYCSAKCAGKRYIFSYHGKEYVKCQYLGCNFRFPKIMDECDVDSIMSIIDGEQEFKRVRK